MEFFQRHHPLNVIVLCDRKGCEQQRGRNDGHELDDWLQAESEVTQQKAKIAAA
jgi:hypothetical protein